MHEWLFFPSLWQFFPTAIVHLVFVELRAVWAVHGSFWFIVEVLASLDPEYRKSDYRALAVYIFVGLQGVPTSLIVLYHFYRFICVGAPMSCGSGAYLTMTWRIEQSNTYRFLVLIMFVIPAFFLITVLHDLAMSLSGMETLKKTDYGNLKDRDMLLGIVIPFVTITVALIGLLSPQMPPNGWDDALVTKITFKRSWSEFGRSNDIYGLRIIDAIWKAKNGRTDEMLEYVEHPEDVDIALDACRESL